jgi:hypothetical protein
MTSPFETVQKARIAALTGMVWVLALFIPLTLGGIAPMPERPFWWVFGGIYCYFIFTGIRALQRGWRSRFVLRIVVPCGLFAVSSLLVWISLRWWTAD